MTEQWPGFGGQLSETFSPTGCLREQADLNPLEHHPSRRRSAMLSFARQADSSFRESSGRQLRDVDAEWPARRLISYAHAAFECFFFLMTKKYNGILISISRLYRLRVMIKLQYSD